MAAADGIDDVKLWNPATGRPAGTVPYPHARAVTFNPGGTLLAVAGFSGVELWNVSPLRLIRTLPGHTAAVAFDHGGTLLAAAEIDGSDVVWNPATGAQVGGPIPAGANGGGIAFSPDGPFLAAVDPDGYIRIWNAATGYQVAGAAGHPGTGGATAIAFSPDGTMLAPFSDGPVKLWNRATGALVGQLPAHAAIAVAFSPRPGLLASADSDSVVLWMSPPDRRSGPRCTRPTAPTSASAPTPACWARARMATSSNGPRLS